uniref:Uncharacterized protein n=1 Tax=Nymphaea colorata TaxID=210225 RepID=A0A5K0ZZ51_9MAGN
MAMQTLPLRLIRTK